MLVHWIWLITRKHVSRRQQLRLLEHFSDPEEIYRCSNYPEALRMNPQGLDSLLDKDLSAAARVVKGCSDRRLSVLTMQDAAYPNRLRKIADPPLVLFCRGVLPDMEGQPVIGVVGTRGVSPGGKNTARSISRQIAACGGLVVSGGALGVDTEALQGALDAGKPAVAVLGCGADVAYPKSNRVLLDEVAEHGCVLSEYLPGTAAAPWQFPERNRIISGLSDGILVTEAPEKSGALITARDAMEQGRDVYAVPGSPELESCAGSNMLLRDGATVVLTGWDVLRNYAGAYPDVEQREFVPARKSVETPAPRSAQSPIRQPDDKKGIDNPEQCAYSDSRSIPQDLDETSRRVLSCMTATPMSMDALAAKADVSVLDLMQLLTDLTLMGLVDNHPGGMVSAK